MFVPAEDMLDEILPLLRDPHPAALKELVEPRLRRKSYLHLAQRFIGHKARSGIALARLLRQKEEKLRKVRGFSENAFREQSQ
jgi:hypothetical protein